MYNVLDKADSLEEQLNHANEALITGDSDDPPLSEKGAATCSDWLPGIATSNLSAPWFPSEPQMHSTPGVRLRVSFEIAPD